MRRACPDRFAVRMRKQARPNPSLRAVPPLQAFGLEKYVCILLLILS